MDSGSSSFEVLDRALRRLGSDVTLEERAGTVRYLRGARPFVVLRVLKSRVDVGFHKLGRARSKRILLARTARLPLVPYRVVVEAPGDVDTELLAWLAESYMLAAEA